MQNCWKPKILFPFFYRMLDLKIKNQSVKHNPFNSIILIIFHIKWICSSKGAARFLLPKPTISSLPKSKTLRKNTMTSTTTHNKSSTSSFKLSAKQKRKLTKVNPNKPKPFLKTCARNSQKSSRSNGWRTNSLIFIKRCQGWSRFWTKTHNRLQLCIRNNFLVNSKFRR